MCSFANPAGSSNAATSATSVSERRSVRSKKLLPPPLHGWRCDGVLPVLPLAQPPAPRLECLVLARMRSWRLPCATWNDSVPLWSGKVSVLCGEHWCLCPYLTSDARVMVTNNHQSYVGLSAVLETQFPLHNRDTVCCELWWCSFHGVVLDPRLYLSRPRIAAISSAPQHKALACSLLQFSGWLHRPGLVVLLKAVRGSEYVNQGPHTVPADDLEARFVREIHWSQHRIQAASVAQRAAMQSSQNKNCHAHSHVWSHQTGLAATSRSQNLGLQWLETLPAPRQQFGGCFWCLLGWWPVRLPGVCATDLPCVVLRGCDRTSGTLSSWVSYLHQKSVVVVLVDRVFQESQWQQWALEWHLEDFDPFCDASAGWSFFTCRIRPRPRDNCSASLVGTNTWLCSGGTCSPAKAMVTVGSPRLPWSVLRLGAVRFVASCGDPHVPRVISAALAPLAAICPSRQSKRLLGWVSTFLCSSPLLTEHHRKSKPASFVFRARLSSLGGCQLSHSRPVHVCTPVLDSCTAAPVFGACAFTCSGLETHATLRKHIVSQVVPPCIWSNPILHVRSQVILLLAAQVRVRTTTGTAWILTSEQAIASCASHVHALCACTHSSFIHGTQRCRSPAVARCRAHSSAKAPSMESPARPDWVRCSLQAWRSTRVLHPDEVARVFVLVCPASTHRPVRRGIFQCCCLLVSLRNVSSNNPTMTQREPT